MDQRVALAAEAAKGVWLAVHLTVNSPWSVATAIIILDWWKTVGQWEDDGMRGLLFCRGLCLALASHHLDSCEARFRGAVKERQRKPAARLAWSTERALLGYSAQQNICDGVLPQGLLP